MRAKNKLPVKCPACEHNLHVQVLACAECGTKVEGVFELPLLTQLSKEELVFVTDFIICSGSLKEMAKKMQLSYPTVRNLLDDIIQKIKNKP